MSSTHEETHTQRFAHLHELITKLTALSTPSADDNGAGDAARFNVFMHVVLELSLVGQRDLAVRVMASHNKSSTISSVNTSNINTTSSVAATAKPFDLRSHISALLPPSPSPSPNFDAENVDPKTMLLTSGGGGTLAGAGKGLNAVFALRTASASSSPQETSLTTSASLAIPSLKMDINKALELESNAANGLSSSSARGEGDVSGGARFGFTDSNTTSASSSARDSSADTATTEGTSTKISASNTKKQPSSTSTASTSSSTMLERQNLWLAAKDAKELARKTEAERAIKDSITSKPDTRASRKSFSVQRENSMNADKGRAALELSEAAASAVTATQAAVVEKERKAKLQAAAKKTAALTAKSELSAAEKYDLLMNPRPQSTNTGSRRPTLGKKASSKRKVVNKSSTDGGTGEESKVAAAVVEEITVEDRAVNDLLAVAFSPTTNTDQQHQIKRRSSCSNAGDGKEAFKFC